tara:strand:- start:1337 stop:1528 length:192 start_codon:yes stop_codon:yes gene_type:complete
LFNTFTTGEELRQFKPWFYKRISRFKDKIVHIDKLILRTDFNSASYGTASTAFIGLSEIWFED